MMNVAKKILAFCILLCMAAALPGLFMEQHAQAEEPECKHSWSRWSIVDKPSCTKTGFQMRYCLKCGLQQDDTVPKAAHQWGKAKNVKAATCSKAGSETRTCKVCGTTRTFEIKMAEHSWGESRCIVKEACCIEGEYIRTCTVCGFTEKEIVPKTPHTWLDWEEVSAATAFRPGIVERTCAVCHVVEKEYTYPAGTLEIGSPQESAVTLLQLLLKQGGYLSDTADGIFGNRTLNAVKNFQQQMSHEPTGTLMPGQLMLLMETIRVNEDIPNIAVLLKKLNMGGTSNIQFTKAYSQSNVPNTHTVSLHYSKISVRRNRRSRDSIDVSGSGVMLAEWEESCTWGPNGLTCIHCGKRRLPQKGEDQLWHEKTFVCPQCGEAKSKFCRICGICTDCQQPGTYCTLCRSCETHEPICPECSLCSIDALSNACKDCGTHESHGANICRICRRCDKCHDDIEICVFCHCCVDCTGYRQDKRGVCSACCWMFDLSEAEKEAKSRCSKCKREYGEDYLHCPFCGKCEDCTRLCVYCSVCEDCATLCPQCDACSNHSPQCERCGICEYCLGEDFVEGYCSDCITKR